MQDNEKNIFFTDATYDYAVPMPVPSVSSDQDSVFSKSSSRGSAKVRNISQRNKKYF